MKEIDILNTMLTDQPGDGKSLEWNGEAISEFEDPKDSREVMDGMGGMKVYYDYTANMGDISSVDRTKLLAADNVVEDTETVFVCENESRFIRVEMCQRDYEDARSAFLGEIEAERAVDYSYTWQRESVSQLILLATPSGKTMAGVRFLTRDESGKAVVIEYAGIGSIRSIIDEASGTGRRMLWPK